mmetsp:Transcript_47798/g.154023  ORF Transcript_47798/g.154023 Transcript_47798/m.154023 type:complete len:377 (-) Transcript_47798:1278-2408(-)
MRCGVAAARRSSKAWRKSCNCDQSLGTSPAPTPSRPRSSKRAVSAETMRRCCASSSSCRSPMRVTAFSPSRVESRSCSPDFRSSASSDLRASARAGSCETRCFKMTCRADKSASWPPWTAATASATAVGSRSTPWPNKGFGSKTGAVRCLKYSSRSAAGPESSPAPNALVPEDDSGGTTPTPLELHAFAPLPALFVAALRTASRSTACRVAAGSPTVALSLTRRNKPAAALEALGLKVCQPTISPGPSAARSSANVATLAACSESIGAAPPLAITPHHGSTMAARRVLVRASSTGAPEGPSGDGRPERRTHGDFPGEVTRSISSKTEHDRPGAGRAEGRLKRGPREALATSTSTSPVDVALASTATGECTTKCTLV